MRGACHGSHPKRCEAGSLGGGDAGGERGVTDRPGEGLGAVCGTVLGDRRAAEGARDGDAVLGQRGVLGGRLLEVGQGDARILLLEFDEEAVAEHVLGGAGAGLGGGLPGGRGQHLGLGGRRCPRDAGDREGPGEDEDDGEDEGESSADSAGCGVHGGDGSEE